MNKQVVTFLLMALTPASAFAVDGAALINQSTITAAGGFPYSITQPGSYKLSGNLVVPAGTNGIGIAASNVTLDLNGFTINMLGSGTAVYAVGSPSMIAVRNGSIVVPLFDGSAAAVSFRTQAGINIQDLMVSTPAGFSIAVGPNSIVRHNIATGLITATCPAVVAENVTTGFLTYDITSGNCVIWNNRAIDQNTAVQQ